MFRESEDTKEMFILRNYQDSGGTTWKFGRTTTGGDYQAINDVWFTASSPRYIACIPTSCGTPQWHGVPGKNITDIIVSTSDC
jgi:hypothetical protein